jgi:phage tail-like protein
MADASASSDYPLPAFHFSVMFAKIPGKDTAFQDVSGISSEIDVQEVVEGGENRFVHRLPKGVKHPVLKLKRGIAGITSPLVIWCKSVLEGDLIKPIKTQDITVFLLDESQTPVRGWRFTRTYPVKWEIDAFNSTKNEVAIETIELSYNDSARIR